MICHLTLEIPIELLDIARHDSEREKHPYLHTKKLIRRKEHDILIFKNNFGLYYKLMIFRQDLLYMAVRRNA